jgi:hypothetical protein
MGRNFDGRRMGGSCDQQTGGRGSAPGDQRWRGGAQFYQRKSRQRPQQEQDEQDNEDTPLFLFDFLVEQFMFKHC